MTITQAAERVHRTFDQWKRKQIPDKTAFYHTALDIAYRHGGLPERLALLHLRYRRSAWRGKILLASDKISRLVKLGGRLRS